ncbi:MAG: RNA methyltransferase [Mariniblastus sp.]|nr:RNA methyltransferase [Mariniblastus sp.]
MERITELEDPRLDPYRELKKNRHSVGSDYFVAEGRFVVERLISSKFEIQSVLVTHDAPKDVEGLDSVRSPVLQVDQDVCQKLVGFPFHRGIMACGKREVRSHCDDTGWPERTLLVACPETELAENLGGIIRNSAALGVQAVLVGRRTVDPFSRRAIRTSMGNCFRLPIIQPPDLLTELARLKSDFQFETIGLSTGRQAISITEAEFPGRTVLLLGNEGFGLSPEFESICDRQVKIPMVDGMDSLNVASAAAIAMFTFQQSSSGIERS